MCKYNIQCKDRYLSSSGARFLGWGSVRFRIERIYQREFPSPWGWHVLWWYENTHVDNVCIRRVACPVFKCEANGSYIIFECATVLGGLYKVGLHIVSRDRKYTKLVDHLVTSLPCSVVFAWPILDAVFGREL